MTGIVLVALNARFIHAAFGIRYLMANLGPLRDRAVVREFTIDDRPVDVLEAVLSEGPRLVGVGVYIWNARLVTELVGLLRRVAPEVTVVVGGPEISHETGDQELAELADYVITGEADVAFADLARAVLAGDPPPRGVIAAELPALDELSLPYDHYTDEDVRHRVVYVEASRGCPFRCEFCLSALDARVRAFPLEPFLAAMEGLYDRGVRHFKFVDRTFNLDLARSRAILEFFRRRVSDDLLVHFEMIPDRFPEALRGLIASFPPGVLQFEVGIQTFDEEVAARIDRRQDAARIAANLAWLRHESGVHVHADLIVGLPGETVAGFGRGFDRLWSLRPHEIQVGILKRLRGAPIARHDAAWGMVYSALPPYQVLATGAIPFVEMQEMARFARFWDLIGNSGHYVDVLRVLLDDVAAPFEVFRRLAAGLHVRFGRVYGIAAPRLARAVFDGVVEAGHADVTVARAMVTDHLRGGRLQLPEFLRPFLSHEQRAWIAERRHGVAGRAGLVARRQLARRMQ